MAAQKCKKSCKQVSFAFLNAYYPKTHLIKALNSLDSFRPYGKPLENQEEGALENYFCLKMICRASQKTFVKKIHFWRPGNQSKVV